MNKKEIERELTPEEQAIVQKIYNRAFAKTLSDKCDSKLTRFRKPSDSPAQRIANEFVVNYLISHSLDFTSDTAETESKQFLTERHDTVWIARKLKLNPTQPLLKQLLTELGKISDPALEKAEENNSVKPLHKVPSKVKGGMNEEDLVLLQSTDNAFTTLCMTQTHDQPVEHSVPKPKSHTKTQSKDEEEEDEEFTQLIPDHQPPKLPRFYELNVKMGRKSEASTSSKTKRNYAPSVEDTNIDTVA